MLIMKNLKNGLVFHVISKFKKQYKNNMIVMLNIWREKKEKWLIINQKKNKKNKNKNKLNNNQKSNKIHNQYLKIHKVKVKRREDIIEIVKKFKIEFLSKLVKHIF